MRNLSECGTYLFNLECVVLLNKEKIFCDKFPSGRNDWITHTTYLMEVLCFLSEPIIRVMCYYLSELTGY